MAHIDAQQQRKTAVQAYFILDMAFIYIKSGEVGIIDSVGSVARQGVL